MSSPVATEVPRATLRLVHSLVCTCLQRRQVALPTSWRPKPPSRHHCSPRTPSPTSSCRYHSHDTGAYASTAPRAGIHPLQVPLPDVLSPAFSPHYPPHMPHRALNTMPRHSLRLLHMAVLPCPTYPRWQQARHPSSASTAITRMHRAAKPASGTEPQIPPVGQAIAIRAGRGAVSRCSEDAAGDTAAVNRTPTASASRNAGSAPGHAQFLYLYSNHRRGRIE
jgi:hypothetical protein